MDRDPSKKDRTFNYVRYALLKRAKENDLVYPVMPDTCFWQYLHVIRVRVIADMEYSIKAAIEDKKMTRKEAINFIKNLINRGSTGQDFYTVWTGMTLLLRYSY
jgi:hypothetical protein